MDGKFDLLEITDRPLAKSMLSTNHCIIFDAFYTVYVWKVLWSFFVVVGFSLEHKGKKNKKKKNKLAFVLFYEGEKKGTRSSPLERAASELLAQKFLSEMADRPKWARIKHVLESAEPELFRVEPQKEKEDVWLNCL